MLVKNIINLRKKEHIVGNVFHIFYPDLSTAVLFDADMSECIIYGNKSIVITQLKKINELMNVDILTNVVILSYIMTSNGYRRIDTYKGPISSIGKYLRRY